MTTRVAPSAESVRRHNELADLYHNWPGKGDPDDDPEFVAQAWQIMGLTPADDTSRSADPADEEVLRASSALDGDELQAYWTRGKGLARWSTNPHPWRRLRGLLRKHPRIRDPEGLASHYFKIVFGIWPGERKGSNPVGPG